MSFQTWAVIVGAVDAQEPDWAAGARHIDSYEPKPEQFPAERFGPVPSTVHGLAEWAFDFEEEELAESVDEVVAVIRERLRADLELLRRSWNEREHGRIGNVDLIVVVCDEDEHSFSSAVGRLDSSNTLAACHLDVPD
jgi:hypothetical protein